MGINLNADMGEILAELARKLKGQGRKTTAGGVMLDRRHHPITVRRLKIFLSLTVATIIVGLIYVMFSLVPNADENTKLQEEIVETQQQQQELPGLQDNREKLQNDIGLGYKDYQAALALFDEKGELDALYQTISTIAGEHHLKVVQVKNHEPETHVLFKEVNEALISVDLLGDFNSYMKFRQQLFEERPLLNIQLEKIISPGVSSGSRSLEINLELSTYMIDKKPFVELLNKYKR